MWLEHGIPGRQHHEGRKGAEKDEGRWISDQRPEDHDNIDTGKSEEAKVYSLVH